MDNFGDYKQIGDNVAGDKHIHYHTDDNQIKKTKHWHPGFIRKHRTAKIAEGFEQKATNLPCKCCKGMLEFIEKKKRKLIM